jgi:hypothetical protein
MMAPAFALIISLVFNASTFDVPDLLSSSRTDGNAFVVNLNQSTSGIFSPPCSDMTGALELRTWASEQTRHYQLTNQSESTLAIWSIYNSNQHNVYEGLHNKFEAGEIYKFSQSRKNPSAYRIVVIDAKHIADSYKAGSHTKCHKAAYELLKKLRKELCDEIGGSEHCYGQ